MTSSGLLEDTTAANNCAVCKFANLVCAAHELVVSIQERQQKLALALLEKAKEICANHGVNILR